jgi:hypothetical protein
MAIDRELLPLEKLMLKHLCDGGRYLNGADLTDASMFFGVHTWGHKKWTGAQLCVTWMALRSLEEKGFVTWKGQSRALGHLGYHYGVWTPTEEGIEAAKWGVKLVSTRT